LTGTELYVNEPERWHITIFHTSKYDDARPNPLKPLAPGLQQTESGHRALPSGDALHQEHQTIQKLVGQNQPINLEVISTLLCLWKQRRPPHICTKAPAGLTTKRKLMMVLVLVSQAAFAKVQHSTQCVEYKFDPAQLPSCEPPAGHMLDSALCCCGLTPL